MAGGVWLLLLVTIPKILSLFSQCVLAEQLLTTSCTAGLASPQPVPPSPACAQHPAVLPPPLSFQACCPAVSTETGQDNREAEVVRGLAVFDGFSHTMGTLLWPCRHVTASWLG